MSERPIEELQFLRKLQRLLAEGDFSATYKLALLNALADLSVEGDLARDGSLRVSIDAIAAKFIEYYWPQARPYRVADGAGFVLLQNAGQQAAVINALEGVQVTHPTLAAARAARGWPPLIRKVAAVVVTMPLWKLQTVGSERDEFLYRQAEFGDRSIRLLPGVAQALRALYSLVLDAVRGAWVRQITRIGANRVRLADADLASFLFGSERGSLEAFARVLREHQHGRCLYCRSEIRGNGEVDHFIAWSRYPADLGHNFVLAHPRCNNKKRDFLVYPPHLESWRRHNMERADELAQHFDAARLPYDTERTRAVVRWAYEQGERAGAHAWIEGERFVRLDGSWREVFD